MSSLTNFIVEYLPKTYTLPSLDVITLTVDLFSETCIVFSDILK